eukprot:g6196.t1
MRPATVFRLVVFTVFSPVSGEQKVEPWDVIVYGATPAGIAAAIAASRAGSTRVALLEPGPYVGGMSSPGGIGMRDFRKAAPPCGSVVEWALLNAMHYANGDHRRSDVPVWQPDSHVGEASFRTLLRGAGVRVFTNETVLEGISAVQKRGAVLRSLQTERSGVWVAGQFVDASYEGDLALFAGVTVTYGRESEKQYGEKLAGVRPPAPPFKAPVKATGPDGKLLKFVSNMTLVYGVGGDGVPEVGTADDGVMAFSYRACVSKAADRVPFQAPPGYKASDFELHRRYIKSLPHPPPFGMGGVFGLYPYRTYPDDIGMPGKFDLCDSNTFPTTSDLPDVQRYVMGSRKERAEVRAAVKYYVQGLLHTLAHDPEIPAFTRKSTRAHGLCADHWPENGHFPPQMYVREGLRIVGDRVFTQKDWQHGKSAESVGKGSWGLDIHVVHRYREKSGHVANEGYTSPNTGEHSYELPFSLVLPKRKEAQNLAVPVCLSCSHVTWAGLREEPTLWQLGAASGIAAAMAGPGGALRDVDIEDLQNAVKAQGCYIHV